MSRGLQISTFPLEQDATPPGIPVLPLDVQRIILLSVVSQPNYTCPKDQSVEMRMNSRKLVDLASVCKDWLEIVYPILYKTVALPKRHHLLAFAHTINSQPHLGLHAHYFHYFDLHFPPHFLRLIYLLPNLRHFLSQADSSTLPDSDIDPAKPRIKLWTLEIDPGLRILPSKGGSAGEEPGWRDAKISRWADLSELRSLALISIEATANIFHSTYSFPHLTELHLLHTEDYLSPYDNDDHTFIIDILKRVGHQLRCLRIDEYSEEILPAPKEIFRLCPELHTLSLSGLDLRPLLEIGHPNLKNLLIGDPWSYYRDNLVDEFASYPSQPHALTEDDRLVLKALVSPRYPINCVLPSLKNVLIWNSSFKERESRVCPEIRAIVSVLERKGLRVGDRFACGRDSRWDVIPEEAQSRGKDVGWVMEELEEGIMM